jgi:hypothetical protein
LQTQKKPADADAQAKLEADAKQKPAEPASGIMTPAKADDAKPAADAS